MKKHTNMRKIRILDTIFFLFVVFCALVRTIGTPVSSTSWTELISTDGIKFSGRNAHASCIFNGKIWVTGGRTNSYTTYNLLQSSTVADVWSSSDGAIWAQESLMVGDYYAQNTDVDQPGPIAPWYARYGHSLNAIDIDSNGTDDMMVLLGGYAPYPSNDMWVSEDGTNWLYAGLAPWSPRAWHFTVVFQGRLWVMGGTPLNNEVWYLTNVTKISRIEPMTRSLYSHYTYQLTWEQAPNAPWSPRVGAGLISQWYFNYLRGESVSSSRERMVLVGGYGGWLEEGESYDGFYCRSDTWESYDGLTWSQLNATNSFGGRAWFGLTLMRGEDKRVGSPVGAEGALPPKMYLFGGGFIGSSTSSPKRVTAMSGFADAYWSRDGATWVRISYQEGGGTSTVPFFSSQEWSKTIVDTQTKYLGLWGLSVHAFNFTSKVGYGGELVLIAGDYTGAGDFTPTTYRSKSGLFCDIGGLPCQGKGTCVDGGCQCDDTYTGDNCEAGGGPEVVSPAPLSRPLHLLSASLFVGLVAFVLSA